MGCRTAGDKLQWGRRFSATETLATATGETASPRFNGAAAFQRRKLPSRGTSAGTIIVASMGPPLFSDGNFLCRTGQATPADDASMGPPLFSDGNIS